MQRPDCGAKTLVLIQKAEHADQYGISRQALENRETTAGSIGANRVDLAGSEKRQRVIEDIVDPVKVSGIVEVASVMNDRADLFYPLQVAQMAGDAMGQTPIAHEVALQTMGGSQVEAQQRPGKARAIESRRLQQRMKGDRQPRRCVGEPAEAPVDIAAMPAERAVFELQVYRIERGDRTANFLDLLVSQQAHAPMRAAHKVLVKIEDRDIECVV